MTSKEILNAPVLDIIFDNRNKQYGAYTLRKFYGNRLAFALGTSLGAVILACVLISNANQDSAGLLSIPKPEVIVTDYVIPPDPVTPPPAVKPRVNLPSKSLIFNVPEIVPDIKMTNQLPDINNIAASENLNQRTDPAGGVGTGGPGKSPVSSIVVPGTKPEETVKEVLVQRKPQFPGGDQAWIDFLKKWLQVPDEIPIGERKTVIVQFQVSEEGVVTNFEVLQSAGRSFDNEVLRVLKKMPRWEPAIQNNRKVATTFQQPVTFTSTEN